MCAKFPSIGRIGIFIYKACAFSEGVSYIYTLYQINTRDFDAVFEYKTSSRLDDLKVVLKTLFLCVFLHSISLRIQIK